MIKVKRALISVTDKTGIESLGQGLHQAGVEILSTGGTAAKLRDSGVDVVDVSDVTQFPECLDGRVKTLHPNVHAGILADRSNTNHLDQLTQLGVKGIDLVVVNLYAFEKTAEQDGVTRSRLIESIDIGGPTMLRAGAKNADHVAVVCDPADYEQILSAIREGGIPVELSHRLAAKVFRQTAAYDSAISGALSSRDHWAGLPERLPVGLVKTKSLRYGENPHQKAALYRPGGLQAEGFAGLDQLQGKELSYNNFLDMHAAYGLAVDFKEPACVIVKHQNPCGVGFNRDMASAFSRALDADRVSAFGGVVALNQTLTAAAAEAMTQLFLEVIVAPEVDDGALAVLGKKKNLRVVRVQPSGTPGGMEIRPVMGGWLLQTSDSSHGDSERNVVTERKPTDAENRALEHAWTMVRHVRSNAIVLGDENGILGLGSGQTNRVDAVAHAHQRMEANHVNPSVVVLASDAFFPFRDGLDNAAKAGVTALIQPGGSVRDEEVIAAANEHNIAMVFTGRRSFRH